MCRKNCNIKAKSRFPFGKRRNWKAQRTSRETRTPNWRKIKDKWLVFVPADRQNHEQANKHVIYSKMYRYPVYTVWETWIPKMKRSEERIRGWDDLVGRMSNHTVKLKNNGFPKCKHTPTCGFRKLCVIDNIFMLHCSSPRYCCSPRYWCFKWPCLASFQTFFPLRSEICFMCRTNAVCLHLSLSFSAQHNWYHEDLKY